MAKYQITYNDLNDQAAQILNAKREFDNYEGRLNSIADSWMAVTAVWRL